METIEILDPSKEHDNAILTYTVEAATKRKRKILLGAFLVGGLLILMGVVLFWPLR